MRSRHLPAPSALATALICGSLGGPALGGVTVVEFQQGVNGYASTVDTFIRQALPDATFGGSVVVEWDGEDGGGQNIGLLRFGDIFGGGPGQIPAGATILSATFTYNVGNAGNTGNVNEVLVDWDDAVTYNTFGGEPGVQTDEYGTFVGSISGSAGTHDFDVTASIAAWLDNPGANRGWIFRPTGVDGVEFDSSESGSVAQRPRLVVEYHLATGVEFLPNDVAAVVGQADVPITVYIPPGSNDTTAIEVTLTTDDAGVAVPVGATGSTLTLSFAAGGPTQQNVDIDIGAAGSATITTANDAGLSDDALTVSVAPGDVSFDPSALAATENASTPVDVSLTPGANDTRPVQVTLTTDNAAVAVPAGATGDSLTLAFAAGASAQQSVDVLSGQVGQATISTTNDAGLSDAALAVQVSSGFHFTVTADPRSVITLWDGVLVGIGTNVGGPGAFHVSCGDIDPVPPLRDKIDLRFGPSTVWYPGIGNHEAETTEDMDWLRNEYHNGNGVRTPLATFTNQDGPATTLETNYSWDYGNAHFVMLNEYWNGTSDTGTDGDIVPALYDWLAANLAANSRPLVFIFGHEPAFPFHRHVGDSLDKYPTHRDAFWRLLEDEGVVAYICGHTHVYTRYQPTPDKTWQIDVGNAGNVSGEAPDPQTFLDAVVMGGTVRFDIWRNTTGSFALEDSWSVTLGPAIDLSDAVINRTAYLGDPIPNDTFTVANGGVGTFDYTILEEADWLSVSPDSGSSSGEPDPIDVIYDATGLGKGLHSTIITVSSTEAVNDPQTVTVNLTIETVSPDFDGDADVDLQDHGHLQACLTGAGTPVLDPACLDADLDGDNDVDQDDYGVFLNCLSGADVPAGRTCDDGP